MHGCRTCTGTVRGAAAALAMAFAGADAAASERTQAFGAVYDISFLGLTVGEATLVVSWTEAETSFDLRAGLRGLAGFFLDGSGSASTVVQRAKTGGPALRFRVDSRYAGKPIRVAMQIADGRVRETSVEPEPTPRPDRVPVTLQDKAGVVDPLSMLGIPLGTVALTPGLCDRQIPVFDGASRADLVLSRGTVVEVQEDAYRGSALDCRVRWIPIAGHRANGPNVRRMAANDDMRVRLAPAPGQGVLLPLEISVATGWGTVRIVARRWGDPAASTAATGRPSVRVSLPAQR